jgi:uncharacterized circularly permuted ATP-grasp superfamily protein
LSKKKEQLVEAISREMKTKYMLSELVATEDNIRTLAMKRNKVLEELRRERIKNQSSLSQEEVRELRTMFRASDPRSTSERTFSTLLREISPIALVLAFASLFPISNVFAFLVIIIDILLRQKKQEKEHKRILESLSPT